MIYHLKIEIERAFQEIIERAGCKYTNVTFSLSDIVLKTEGITLYNDKWGANGYKDWKLNGSINSLNHESYAVLYPLGIDLRV